MSDDSTPKAGFPAPELVQSAVELLQEDALPGVWTKGVNLSRVNGSVIQESGDDDSGEWKYRVIETGRAVHPRVTLWLSHDDDFDSHCSCGDRNEPCHHIIAVSLALKGGRAVQLADAQAAGAGAAASGPGTAALSWIEYRLSMDPERRLAVSRIVRRANTQELLSTTLVAHLGGIRSGRISAPPVATTEEDLKIDSIFGPTPGTRVAPDSPAWGLLLKLFKRLPEGRLRWFEGSASGKMATSEGESGRTIRAETETERDSVTITLAPGGGGYVARRTAKSETGTDSGAFIDFVNGVRLQGDALRPLPPSLAHASRAERELFSQMGLPRSRTVELLTEVLPSLHSRFDVRIDAAGFPELVPALSLHAEVRLEADPSDPATMIAVPELVYSDPARGGSPVARLSRPTDGWQLEDSRRVPERDPAREHELTRLLQSELHLAPGALTRHSGEQAASFRKRLEDAAANSRGRLRTAGGALGRFAVHNEFLRPRVQWNPRGEMELDFILGPSSGSISTGQVSARAAFDAWRRGDSSVLLGAGGFAKLPSGWFDKYGHEVERLLLVRPIKNAPGHAFDPLDFERADFALTIDPECKARIPEGLAKLKQSLHASLEDEAFGDFPDSRTPLRSHRVQAQLRPYQRLGVRWLRLLGDHGLGALLADDMGLGKTLQAIEASEGRTLVVCPTSVLYAWETQLAKFSPQLRVSRYHGSSRRLDPSADLTLTTYGVLRQDQGVLTTTEWDTVILDEAQTIKNPDSQVAQAAHELRAARRIALSGTPLENHLEELWSSMRFLNPTLLGDRKGFLLGAEERGGLEHLRRRIRPFFLRRLKREVARDLPPRTEQVLECELTAEERRRYDALWLASRREVIEALEAGTGTMQALELLLRLRQACCHTGLLPGFEDASSSSKLDLLVETLRTALENEHRVLVFSQWTRMLDRIQARLQNEKGADWLRLDGSTSREERSRIIKKFQEAGPESPRILLLSLKAGGTGLTLTAADTVILTDPWWNPAVEDQAADRAHRIGQSLPVTVIRLIAKDSVEERILALQQEKRALAEAIFGSGKEGEAPPEEGTSQATGLGTRELLRLLGE